MNRSYSTSDKIDIWRRVKEGESYGSIAEDYGVSKSAICGLIYRMRHS